MARKTTRHKTTERAIARMARIAAKLMSQLEAAGQTEAARDVRNVTMRAADAMRAGPNTPTPVPTGAATPSPVPTTEQVLAAARTRGVTAFGPSASERKVLLASLGLDLARADVCTTLLDLHRRREIRLARIDLTAGARASLAERGHHDSLLFASEIRTPDGIATFHAVALS